MSFLTYCILRRLYDAAAPSLTGIACKPVMFVSTGELSAAVSRVDASNLVLDYRQVMAYEKVIAFLHRTLTVIPMRFGCVLDEEVQVIRLLEDQGERYAVLLRELDGHVEMGIRILPHGTEWSSSRAAQKPLPRGGEPGCFAGGSGRDYLLAQRECYARMERTTREKNAAIEEVRAAFAGLFSKCREESGDSAVGCFALPAPLASLHFLVPRRSEEEFRKRFHVLEEAVPSRLLLSGPWPPYNFVVLETM